MTIDEAIKQFKYDAECNRADLDLSYAEDNEQIAKWLEELKGYRDKNKMVVHIDIENMDSIKDKIEELTRYAESQYNKAIDDFAEKVKEMYAFTILEEVQLEKIAEQLKAGEQNESV